MDNTNSSENKQRRLEDRKPEAVIDWSAPEAPAKPPAGDRAAEAAQSAAPLSRRQILDIGARCGLAGKGMDAKLVDFAALVRDAEPQPEVLEGPVVAEEIPPAATSGDAPTDLQQLKALALAATPGPWTYFPKPKYNEHHVSLPMEGSGMRLALFDTGCQTERPEQDARFIAAANPAVVLDLIARIERVEGEFKNFHRALCARFGYTHDERDWKRDQVSLEEHIAARIERAAAPAPTDLSKRLRDAADSGIIGLMADKAMLLAAADEIERYYGGMMAWKRTAEKKDADWNAERMARVDERCAARAAVSAATKPTADLSNLQSAYDIMHKALCEISQPADEGCSHKADAESMRETAIDALSDAERIIDFGVEQSLLATKPAAQTIEGDFANRSRAELIEYINYLRGVIDSAATPAAQDQAKAEPVAWMRESDKSCVSAADKGQMERCDFGQWSAIAKRYTIPLYATPAASSDAVKEAMPDALPLLKRLKRDLMSARRFQADTLDTYRRACTSAETDIEEFLNECRALKSAATQATEGAGK